MHHDGVAIPHMAEPSLELLHIWRYGEPTITGATLERERMSNQSPSEAAVAVVGGGPIGLTAFITLRRMGVDAVLVERHAGTAIVPKALQLNERTMEVFRQLGLEDDVRAASLPRDEVGYLYAGASVTAASYDRFPLVHQSDKTGVLSQLCSQDALEPVLRAHAERLAPGRVQFGTQLVALTQDAENVELRLVDAESRAVRTLKADYLVAADGSRSTVRELLGIRMDGDAALQHSMHVVFDAPMGPLVEDRASAMYYIQGLGAGDVYVDSVMFVIVDGDRRWRLMFDYDPQADQDFGEDALRALIRKAVGVPDLEVEIRGIFPWEPAALLAETFRAGRVLLVGDAAHVRPPWGGLGMNAGIGDAHNLAWKLAEVVAGRAGDALVDTYEQERRPIAQRTIEAAIGNNGQGNKVRSPDQAVRVSNNRRRRAEGLVLGYTYTSPAVIPDGTSAPVVEDEQVDYVPTARPGHRAPHFEVEHGSAIRSITDLFGADFVLLTGPAGTVWRDAADSVAADLATSLRAYVVGGVAGDLGDPLGRWSELYCSTADGAVLVRPDGHVAWRTTAVPDDPRAALLAALTSVLGLARSTHQPA